MEVIQIGGQRWAQADSLPEDVRWTIKDGESELFSEEEDRPLSYDVIILDGPIADFNVPVIKDLGAPYTYFYTENMSGSDVLKEVLTGKSAKPIGQLDIDAFVKSLPVKYFRGQHGAKLPVENIYLHEPFQSAAAFDGHRALIIDAVYGEKFRPAAGWRYNIFLSKGQVDELWLEYSREQTAAIQLRVTVFKRGSLDMLESMTTYDEEDLREPILVRDSGWGSYISVLLLAKGAGRIELGPLHFRQSRLGEGQFLPGGRRHAFAGGQEFISYFSAGDRKPPLNVYFSGYRTAEGFEGYYIMNSMNSPFLLIGDPRLEGGAFYLGSEEFEAEIVHVIEETLRTLGFTRKDLILSGMSMGTFGAVYYGSALKPHAVIIGKPLMNLGNVAANEKRLRPDGFPTSLDVLRSNTGGNGEKEIRELNERLWKRFDAADFSDTEFVVSYMYQDDYDADGYPDILAHLRDKKVPIVSKGLEGRHNDNTNGVVNWFMSQYRRILSEDFGRE
ncbi:MAG: accessory Sec system protein Asp2 [Lachnospiraceae bacterium]|nr:accessory Sec system protein Asp2 [Lachnospiraceae bacterium]